MGIFARIYNTMRFPDFPHFDLPIEPRELSNEERLFSEKRKEQVQFAERLVDEKVIDRFEIYDDPWHIFSNVSSFPENLKKSFKILIDKFLTSPILIIEDYYGNAIDNNMVGFKEKLAQKGENDLLNFLRDNRLENSSVQYCILYLDMVIKMLPPESQGDLLQHLENIKASCAADTNDLEWKIFERRFRSEFEKSSQNGSSKMMDEDIDEFVESKRKSYHYKFQMTVKEKLAVVNELTQLIEDILLFSYSKN